MFGLQTHFIFPRHAVGSPGPLPKAAERLTLATADGETLHGVHIPPKAGAGGRTLVIGFAGNAWNSQDAAVYLHELYPAADIVQFHYRGYTPSSGQPSAKALLGDALAIHDFAVKRVAARKVVAVGFSIGSGVAAHLASKRRLDGVILVTPFDSLKAVASDQFPWLPVAALFDHEMDAAAALASSDVPSAIITAEADTLIRSPRSDGLRRAAGNLSYNRTVNGAGHNDIYQRSDFHQAMREALTTLTR
jgi:pimeloyl-ACP methyl ester carboxylesterase